MSPRTGSVIFDSYRVLRFDSMTLPEYLSAKI